MISRALFVLFVFLLVDARAQSGTYERGEDFASAPNNWRQTSPSQFYGYQRTKITGGVGAAGGLFLSSTGFNHYADIFLGGGLTRGTRISAEGRLALKRASGQPPYLTTAYIGHFGRPVGKYVATLGIALIGNGDSFIYASAILEFSNGYAYTGDLITLPVGGDFMHWNYNWDPTGGKFHYGALTVKIAGQTSTLVLPDTSIGYDFSLNAFGEFQPVFQSSNSSFLYAYIGGLTYTATTGKPPAIKVNAPRTVATTTRGIDFTGTADVATGYRIQSVTVRVNHGGKIGAFKTATGGENWSVRVNVPRGRSHVQFVATSDSGLTTTVKRTVNRRP